MASRNVSLEVNKFRALENDFLTKSFREWFLT